MVTESYYWKEELARSGTYLVDRLKSSTWNTRSLARLEKTIMISLYSIRKLVEATKVPKEFFQRKVAVDAYPAKVRRISTLDRNDFETNYDLDRPKRELVKISFLINQIIHSFVYMPLIDRNGRIAAILFNSDKTKTRSLYRIPIRSIVNLINTVAEKSIVSYTYKLIDGQMELVDTIYRNDWPKIAVRRQSTAASR